MKDMLGKSGFDVIGDVHGHAAELTILFKRMGYQETNGVLRHPEGRRVVFLGDFIDRGPEIRRTLEIVRGMVEAGSALAVMGNHELNCFGRGRSGGDGSFRRPDERDVSFGRLRMRHDGLASQALRSASPLETACGGKATRTAVFLVLYSEEP